MLSRRLLIAGPGAALLSPLVTLTSPSAGGWTQIPEARAIYYNGVTYFTYVNGSNGNVEIRTYTNATRITSSAFVLKAALGADTHNAPALLIRDSDKRIVAAYSGHNGAALYIRISTNPEDITAWAAETNIDASVGGGSYTYPILIQRLGETNDPIYLYIRNRVSTTTHLISTVSTDGGATWSAKTDLYAVTGEGTYWKIASDGNTRTDFVVTDSNPQEAASSIYHFYDEAGTFKASDGTSIGSPEFNASDPTLVYDTASAGPAWAHDLILDGTTPLMLYAVELGGDTSYRYARWDGAAWDLSTMALGNAGQDVPTIGCLDGEDVNRAYLTLLIDTKFEIWRYSTNDDGATWDGGAITSGSTVDQMYPVKVHNHPLGELAVLWVYGDSDIAGGTFDVDFDLGIKGIAV